MGRKNARGLELSFNDGQWRKCIKVDGKSKFVYFGKGKGVTHRLWTLTQNLIIKTMNGNGDGRVFMSENGYPLVRYSGVGKNRIDAIGLMWTRLCQKVGVKGFGFSNLRDTSATLVERFDRTLTDKFLSHRDDRVAAYYIDGSSIDRCLDKAVDMLEKEYGLTL